VNTRVSAFDDQQVRLQALGIVPLRLRTHLAPPHAVDVEAPSEPSPSQPASRCVRLWFADRKNRPTEGPQARLLEQILRSVGLSDAEVAVGPDEAGDDDWVILAFGVGAPASAVSLPTLERLRDPLEKRIAWPILRRLRRRLADSGIP
jgi:hypothetical protein